MSADMSLYFANKVLRWMAGNAMPTAPQVVYLALYDGDPKGAGVEITQDIRPEGRVAISFAALAQGFGNELDSNADVDFGNSVGDSLNLSHAAVFDTDGYEDGGNMLWSKSIPGGPYAIVAGELVKFNSGDLTWTAGS